MSGGCFLELEAIDLELAARPIAVHDDVGLGRDGAVAADT